MRLDTKHFGPVEINEDKIIHFNKGLIAFNEEKRYCILENQDKGLPFCWLQSVDKPDLVFVIINPFLFKKDYDFEISDEDMKELDVRGAEEAAVFSIVVIPEDIKKMTVNLLAPLIINTRTKQGKQIVLPDKHYSTRHLILEEMQKTYRKGCSDASSDKKER